MGTLVRNGDIVSVSGVVSGEVFGDSDGTQKVKVRIKPYHDIYVLVSEVTVVKPEFRVGDQVKWLSGEDAYRGEVLAIADEHLWIDRGAGYYSTVWTGSAQRVDPEPEPAAVTATESTYVAMQAAMSAAEEPPPIPDMEPRVPRFGDGDDRSGEAE